MLVFIFVMIIISIASFAIHFQHEIKALNARLDDMTRKHPVEHAPKFRVRTAESDPNRRATVKFARVRAIKYITPPPRR
jgi:hypothetical protein